MTSTTASSAIIPVPAPSIGLKRPPNPTGLKSNMEIERTESVYYAFVGELDAEYDMFTLLSTAT
eukprot:6928151-Prorocentrum_lima.AAC.1